MNQLEQTPLDYKKSIEKLENENKAIFVFCLILILAICIVVVLFIMQRNVISYQQDRIENLILAADSYKNLLLTPNK